MSVTATLVVATSDVAVSVVAEVDSAADSAVSDSLGASDVAESLSAVVFEALWLS
ncbi:hypothetical protein [Mycolicibacterium sp.]|uniref:hypothetical protein n=1 Tax=Mycolicibacterium sp. TaxID=2320850 RepID=UPI0037CB7C50